MKGKHRRAFGGHSKGKPRRLHCRVGTRNEMIGTLVLFGHHCGGPVRNFWMLNSELRYTERSSQLLLPGSGCKTEKRRLRGQSPKLSYSCCLGQGLCALHGCSVILLLRFLFTLCKLHRPILTKPNVHFALHLKKNA